MKHIYKKTIKLRYNNQIFQVLVRDDHKFAFLNIVDKDAQKYSYPTAHEFLHLSSMLNINNRIKF